MKNRELSDKTHWDSVSGGNFRLWNALSNSKLMSGYGHFALISILTDIFSDDGMKKQGNKLIEIGCAPGNYLIKFKKSFNFDVFGVEYSETGYKKTIQNLKDYSIPEKNIILGDFFDEKFLSNNLDAYDVLFSAGFIEHFEKPKDVVERMLKLVKKGGFVVCLIPNGKRINAFFADKKLLEIHNLSIMELDKFRQLFEFTDTKIKYCDFFGGLFNVGLFNKKNRAAKFMVMLLLVIQRIFIDNLQKVVYLVTKKDLTNKYSSPYLLCVLKK